MNIATRRTSFITSATPFQRLNGIVFVPGTTSSLSLFSVYISDRASSLHLQKVFYLEILLKYDNICFDNLKLITFDRESLFLSVFIVNEY